MRPTVKQIFILSAIVLFSASLSYSQEPEPLTVHEWGTITSQHFNNGLVSGHMNVIREEEVLPDFVHRLDQTILQAFDKSPGTGGHRSVTMRLETPVIYFYPSENFDRTQPINVSVEFWGGLLNEYYPSAMSAYANLNIDSQGQTDIDEDTVGYLSWSSILLGGPWSGPRTDANVWTAPRNVKAANLRIATGESEKYLFYRGVGHLNSLLKTTHTMDTREIRIYNPENLSSSIPGPLTIPEAWVLHVGDHGAAYRSMGPITLTDDPDEILTTVSANFSEEEYKSENIQSLREAIHQSLVKNGLYEEEAAAMLNTWQNVYFEQPGTRIFFIVPRAWIDHQLPLKFSVPVKLERVFIGRIDLVM